MLRFLVSGVSQSEQTNVNGAMFPNVPAVVRNRMAKIKKRHTKPELIVRRVAHGLGYRFRLHGQGMPGTPDLIFASRRKVIFVHGCFWHQHDCALGRRRPKSRLDYWDPKLARNVARDRVVLHRRLGWPHALYLARKASRAGFKIRLH